MRKEFFQIPFTALHWDIQLTRDTLFSRALIFFPCFDLIFGLGFLKSAGLFNLMGSWIDRFRSSSTSLTKLLYCPFPVSSSMYNAAMTDWSAQSRLSRDTRSENSAKKGLPIFLMMLQRLVTCLWKVFCVDRPCSWFRKFWELSGLLSAKYSLSNCFRSLDSSGPDSIQRLKAAGFSVRPLQPPSLSRCGFLAHVLDRTEFQRMYCPFFK